MEGSEARDSILDSEVLDAGGPGASLRAEAKAKRTETDPLGLRKELLLFKKSLLFNSGSHG